MKNLYPIFLIIAIFVTAFRKPHNGESHEEDAD